MFPVLSCDVMFAYQNSLPFRTLLSDFLFSTVFSFCISASFPNAFSTQSQAQLQQAAAQSPAGKQTEGE